MEAPPAPGVRASGSYEQEVSSEVKTASSMPAHLRETPDDSDRRYVLSNFEKTPLGLAPRAGEPIGYVVTIPLNKKAVAQSIVQNGRVPEAMLKKHANTFFQKEAKSLSVEPLEDEVMEKTAKSDLLPEIKQLPGGDLAGDRLIERRINSPMPPRDQFPAQGKFRLSPESTVVKHDEKRQWDIQAKTTRPWDDFKKVPMDSKLAAYAKAFKIDLSKYANFDIWNSPDTPATLLDITMLAQFGADWLTWEPETLDQILGGAGVGGMSDETREKLMALQVLHSTDSFWEEESVFEKICLALNGISPDFHIRQDLSVAQIAKAVAISKQLKNKPFGDEIISHIVAKAHLEGLIYLPRVLSFGQIALNKIQKNVTQLVPQIELAYSRNWPVGDVEDALNIQLRKLYAIDNFVNS